MKIALLVAMFAATSAESQNDHTKYFDESSPVVRCLEGIGDVVCEFRTAENQPMFCVAVSVNGKDLASAVSDKRTMQVTFKDVFWLAFDGVLCQPVSE